MQHGRKKSKAGKARQTRKGTDRAEIASTEEAASAAVDRLIAEQLAKGIGDKFFRPEDATRWRIVREAICGGDSVPGCASLSEYLPEPTFELHNALCRQFASWRRLRKFLEQLLKEILPGTLELWRVPLKHARQKNLKKLPESFANEWRAKIFSNPMVKDLIAELIPTQVEDAAKARC